MNKNFYIKINKFQKLKLKLKFKIKIKMSEIITTRESAKKRVKKNPPNELVENFIDSKIRQLEAEVAEDLSKCDNDETKIK